MRPFYFLAITVVVLLSGLSDSVSQDAKTESREKFLHQFTYSGKYLDISAETQDARATFWKPDGTIIYVAGRASNNLVAFRVYNPWQIHTAEFFSEMHLPGEFQHGLYIRDDGMMMWVFDRTSIWTFTMEIPWDITTLSEGINHDLSHFSLRGHDIDFKPDGTILFIDDRNAGAVFEYTLSVPWDVSNGTLTYTLDINDRQIEVRGIEFLEEGSVMMLMDTERKEVMQYNLAEPYSISTAKFFDAFDVSHQTQQGRGLSFSADEIIMYVTAQDEEKIFQYELEKE
jgi:hypothetical protein